MLERHPLEFEPHFFYGKFLGNLVQDPNRRVEQMGANIEKLTQIKDRNFSTLSREKFSEFEFTSDIFKSQHKLNQKMSKRRHTWLMRIVGFFVTTNVSQIISFFMTSSRNEI